MKQTLSISFCALSLSMGMMSQGFAKPSADNNNLKPEATPDFCSDIAPIVYQNCVTCHRPGQAAPFSLITYEDVARRARLSVRLMDRGYMPPWKPVAGHGDFAGERRLTAEEIDLFSQWVAAGKPEGDPADLPPLPEFPDRWPLGEPDLIVKMKAPWSVLADGPDIYRNFVVDTGLDKEVWIRAIDLKPQSPQVVHHVLMFADETGLAGDLDNLDKEPGFSQMIPPSHLLGGYVPGATPVKLPEGLSQRLPNGRPLVLQAHFHPSGKPEVEQMEVGIYLADKPSERTLVDIQMPEMFGIGAGIKIPAGETNYQIEHEITLPVDCEAIAVGGHAHYLGKEVKLTARYPDGAEKSIFYINDWDLDWQGNYTYRKPVKLPKGTILKAEISYDNSDQNSNNPFYPPRDIRWGKESTDEMGSITLLLVPRREKDAAALEKLAVTEKKRAFVGLFRGGKIPGEDDVLRIPKADAIIKTFDTDSSGELSITEFPVLPEKERFAKLDRNGDTQLDRDELNSMVKMMNLMMRFGMEDGPARSWLLKRVMKKRFDVR
ncbi:MAG: hypothetical protein P1V20_06925 [Verrucomicrobiales bacterium]|nr:hypothetical protein [Verrucomicrobiales bacterium]